MEPNLDQHLNLNLTIAIAIPARNEESNLASCL
jgi:hypothetical protein